MSKPDNYGTLLELLQSQDVAQWATIATRKITLADTPGDNPNPHVAEAQTGDVIIYLIDVLRDGQAMHQTALERAESPYLRQVSQQMIDSREAACIRLAAFAIPSGMSVPDDESLANKAVRLWTDIKAALGDTDAVLLDSLVDIEALTVSELRDAQGRLPEGEARVLAGELVAEFSAALESVKVARDAQISSSSSSGIS